MKIDIDSHIKIIHTNKEKIKRARDTFYFSNWQILKWLAIPNVG